MSIVLLLIVVTLSLLIIKAGATALEMTGLDRPTALFQAVSSFSNTGFTTRESERIVNHPRRRRIVTYLIITGNIGFVSAVSTTVLTLRHDNDLVNAVRLLVAILAFIIIYKLLSHLGSVQKINQKMRLLLRQKLGFEDVHIEEILHQAEGTGLVEVLVESKSQLIDKTLQQCGMTHKGLLVLSIQRESELTPVPPADTVIKKGDRLLIYGKMENIKQVV